MIPSSSPLLAPTQSLPPSAAGAGIVAEPPAGGFHALLAALAMPVTGAAREPRAAPGRQIAAPDGKDLPADKGDAGAAADDSAGTDDAGPAAEAAALLAWLPVPLAAPADPPMPAPGGAGATPPPQLAPERAPLPAVAQLGTTPVPAADDRGATPLPAGIVEALRTGTAIPTPPEGNPPEGQPPEGKQPAARAPAQAPTAQLAAEAPGTAHVPPPSAQRAAPPADVSAGALAAAAPIADEAGGAETRLRRLPARSAEPILVIGADLHAEATRALPAPPVGPAPQPALDTTRGDWIEAMIERIDVMRDAAGTRDARIRLAPDALGTLEVSVSHDGERTHVHIAAETVAARTLLSEAQPRLAELAESRGLRLGQSSVDQQGQPGAQQGSQQHARSDRTPPGRADPASARPDDTTDSPDSRIA